MTTRWRQSITGTKCPWLLGRRPEPALQKPRSRPRPHGPLPPDPLSRHHPLCPSAWESGVWWTPDLGVDRSSIMLGPPAVCLRAEDFT